MNTHPNKILLYSILMITLGQCVDLYVSSMPAMTQVLGCSEAGIQFSVTIALIAYGLGAPIYGPLSDHFGRRPIALVGISIFSFGSLICMLSSNLPALLLGRALQGIGFASASGVSAPAINDVFSGADLVKAYSRVGMAICITPVVAPVLGSYLSRSLGWHAPFAFLCLYSLLVLLLFWRGFPETNSHLRSTSLQPTQILAGYAACLRSPRYVGGLLCLVLLFSGEIYYVINAPFIFQTRFGLSAVQNGWLILLTVGGYLFGTTLSGKLCARYTPSLLMGLGGTCAIVGALLMVLLAGTPCLAAILGPMMLFMLGAGLLYPSAIGICISCFPAQRGSANALAATCQQGLCGLFASLASAHFPATGALGLGAVLLGFALLATAMQGLSACSPAPELKRGEAETGEMA